MKVFNNLALVAALLLFVQITYSQQGAKPEPYTIIELEKFTTAFGVDFDDTELNMFMSHLLINFERSRRFESVFMSTDETAQTAPARRVRIVGEITQYNKGSRAARYIIGFGAGRTKLVAEVSVIDAETGNILIKKKMDGHVYGGFFGGETGAAKSGLASEIIKTMTKAGYANKNRLTK